MSIQEFSKLQSEMPTPELIAKARAWNTKLCETGGRAWSLRVPVSEDDPDMIFGEVCRRLEIVSNFDFAFNMVNNTQNLIAALENLLDEQNDAPLERRRAHWETAVFEARAAIAKAKGEAI